MPVRWKQSTRLRNAAQDGKRTERIQEDRQENVGRIEIGAFKVPLNPLADCTVAVLKCHAAKLDEDIPAPSFSASISICRQT